MSFGALGRRKSDANQLKLHPQLTSYIDVYKMQAPPLARPWHRAGGVQPGAVIPISMFGNDKLGDCTCAAQAHLDQILARQLGQTTTITEADVIKLYEGSGYNHETGEGDHGWNNLDAARAAQKAGWIDGFAPFDPCDQLLMKIVINEFGGAYCGIDLPLSAQRQMGKVWDVAPSGSTDDTYDRNTWGGHAAMVVAFNDTGVVVATWGKFQLATWAFVTSYFDEGMALANKRWIEQPLTLAGHDFSELKADLIRLAKGPWPTIG